MELDLDKEIDALHRRTDFSPDGRGVPELGHLEADEIAAFAENAVPDAGRAVYMRHIASCSSCRKTLSHVIALNAESVEQHEEAAAPDVKTAAVPWYGGLFTLTRLAYAMGGLAVIFAGFLAFSVLRGTGGRSTEVSQVSDEPQARTSAPSSAATPIENSYAASAANSNAGTVAKGSAEPLANAAANTTIVAAGPAAAKPSAAELNKSKSAENSFEVDGASGSAASPPPPPPPPASTADSVTALRKDDKAAEKERSNLPMTTRRVDGLQAMRQAET